MIKENMNLRFLGLRIPLDLKTEFQSIMTEKRLKQNYIILDLIRDYVNKSKNTEMQKVG